MNVANPLDNRLGRLLCISPWQWSHTLYAETSLISFQCMTQPGFTIVMWHHSEIGLALPTEFLAAEVIGWTCVSCQAVSPMAWEWGWWVLISYKRTLFWIQACLESVCHKKSIEWQFLFIAVCPVALQLPVWTSFQDSIPSRAHAVDQNNHGPWTENWKTCAIQAVTLNFNFIFLNLNYYLSDSNYNKTHLF